MELLTREDPPLESLARQALFPPYALGEMEHRLGTFGGGPRDLLRAWGGVAGDGEGDGGGEGVSL